MSRLAFVLAVVVLAGCGGEDGGRATLWVTRDQGAHVILQKEVPSGLTAMQALDRVAHIDTRYGGRYVQAINGVVGSLSSRRDWFYFINGYEGDRSAAEYRLRSGDVEWWDFRSWQKHMREPVVVGAFPEPFLHGYAGRRLPARVVYVGRHQRGVAERLAKLLGGRASPTMPDASPMNLLVLVPGTPGATPSFSAELSRGTAPGDPVSMRFRGNPALLLRSPPFGRLRYQVNR